MHRLIQLPRKLKIMASSSITKTVFYALMMSYSKCCWALKFSSNLESMFPFNFQLKKNYDQILHFRATLAFRSNFFQMKIKKKSKIQNSTPISTLGWSTHPLQLIWKGFSLNWTQGIVRKKSLKSQHRRYSTLLSGLELEIWNSRCQSLVNPQTSGCNATLCSKNAKISGCQTLLSKTSAGVRHPWHLC